MIRSKPPRGELSAVKNADKASALAALQRYFSGVAILGSSPLTVLRIRSQGSCLAEARNNAALELQPDP